MRDWSPQGTFTLSITGHLPMPGAGGQHWVCPPRYRTLDKCPAVSERSGARGRPEPSLANIT
ncbi:hypothetical protein E2C01_009126 [Portunus trituberculatus]|uniref:Uncharacterized protein n=1 Tax=Portunus trituberculatus TaxID=210409 RepID=A0A5B7D4L1_PORTR|nr:hypothetical protein [Portunus trituberculatus]